MDAALVTGMFGIGLGTSNTLAKDVFKSKDSNFEDFFSKSLEKEKGVQKEKENIKKVKDSTKKDVDDKDEIKNTDNKEEISETKDKQKTKNKDKVKSTKDEENNMTDKINGLAEKLLKEVQNIDGGNIEFKDVKEILDVENLGLTNEEMLKLQEVLEEKLLQNVVEVGPQSVETEKITFNKYDDLESKLEALEKRLGNNDSKMKIEDTEIKELNPELNGEELSPSLMSSYEEGSSLENKDVKSQDSKMNIIYSVKKVNVDN